MGGLEEKCFGFEREAVCRYMKKKEEGNVGFGFGREGSWVVWKRKGFGFGREDVCRYMKKKEGRKRKKTERDILVLTPFTWFVKLDKCQNFK